MSTVGLTKAMRSFLENWGRAANANSRGLNMHDKAMDAGLIAFYPNSADGPMWKITPRGHAALAAPRMTQAEYALLLRLENWSGIVHGRDVTILHKLARRGLAKVTTGSSGYTKAAGITPAGRTALNNVRAAMGSPEYKENP